MNLLVLDGSKTIELLLSAAPAATQPDFTAHFADVDPDDSTDKFVEGSSDGTLNGVTAVTAISAPASGERRIVREITVYNADSVSVTLTVQLNNGADVRVIEKKTLSSGGRWAFSEAATSASSSGVDADDVTVDTTGFSGLLSATDTDVQAALGTIDAVKQRTYATELSSILPVSSSRIWVDTGSSLDLTLPAGKWDLTAVLLGIIQADGTTNVWAKVRFYNETAGAEVDAKYSQLVWQPRDDTYQRRQSGTLKTIVTLTVTSTIRIEVYFDYGGSTEPAWLARYLSSDTNGKSVVQAVEILQ